MNLTTYCSTRAQEEGIPAKVVLREALQIYLLGELAQCEEARYLTFRGGTALRLVYQEPRYSDDLDFTSVAPLSLLDPLLEQLAPALAELSPLFGGKMTLRIQKQTEELLRLRLSLQAPAQAGSTSLNLEIAHFPSYSRELQPIRLPFALPGLPLALIWVESEEEILADKLVAIAGRSYPKGRDLFDFWFLHSRGIPINRELVRAKFSDYGVQERILKERPASFTAASLRKEMAIFLPQRYRKPLEEDGYRDLLRTAAAIRLELLD
ncbi:MAG: nucleotidyl transferase AbiEii/AbiGii toxin family protein [Coprothermobacterota bacterium]|nr:nucleotidyl transferase AbiEii/AbiGii toxin family protein [Coprothermobacterota bacterium]